MNNRATLDFDSSDDSRAMRSLTRGINIPALPFVFVKLLGEDDDTLAKTSTVLTTRANTCSLTFTQESAQ